MSASLLDDPRIVAAVAAVRAAARITRSVQADLSSAGAERKADDSPVTLADYTAQAVVAHHLEAALGPVRLVAEERADALRAPESADRLDHAVSRARTEWPDVTAEALLDAIDRGAQEPSSEGFWTLDPVDGTKGFLRGAHYAVSLGYVEGGQVVLGALAAPNLALDPSLPVDEMAGGVVAAAARGKGVLQGSLQDESPLNALSPTRLPTDTVRIAESVEAKHSDFDAHAEILEAAGLVGRSVRLDSQAKYMVLARAQADLYLRWPSRRGYVEMIWDHAAGALVAEESGLVVTDFEGRGLDFGQGRRLEKNRGILVATESHHPRLLAAIRNLGYTGDLP